MTGRVRPMLAALLPGLAGIRCSRRCRDWAGHSGPLWALAIAIALAVASPAAAGAPATPHSFSCFQLLVPPGELVGSIDRSFRGILELKDGRVLVWAEKGSFLLGTGATTLEPAGAADLTGDSLDANELKDGRVLVWAEEGWFLLGAGATTLEPVGARNLNGRVKHFAELKDGRFLVLAEKGLFLLDAGATTLEPVGAGNLTGRVNYLTELKDGRVLVRAEKGLFVLNAGATTLEPVGAADLTGPVEPFNELKDGRVLVRAEKGLFLLNAGATTLEPVGAGNLTGRGKYSSELKDGRVLVWAEKGLFLLDAGATTLEPVGAADLTGDLLDAAKLKDGRVLVRAEKGLFLLNAAATTLEPVGAGNLTGRVNYFTELKDGRVLVWAEEGWFLLGAGATTLEPVGARNLNGRVKYLAELKDGRVLVWAEKGLFLLGAGATTLEPVGTADLTGRVTDIPTLTDGWVLVRAEKGLFVLNAGATTLEPVGAGNLTGRVNYFTELKDGRVLGRAEKGLTLLIRDDYRAATVDIAIPKVPAVRQPITIEVKVDSPCAEFIETWRPELRVNTLGRVEGKPAKLIRAEGSRLTFSQEFAAPGPHEVQLFLDDGKIPVGLKREVIAGDFWDVAKHYSAYLAAVLATLHFLAVAGLVLGARRSATCFRIVQDPFWSKAGIYLNFALRHWRPLQLWLLDRYFAGARAECGKAPREPYEPLPITSGDQMTRLADGGVLGLLVEPRRLWIQGPPGMGKTALTRNLERVYFSLDDPNAVDVFSVVRRWKRVLLFVAARQYESVAADDRAPEKWLVTVASRRLAHFGVTFADDTIVRALLDCGTLGLVIDGVNEVGKEDQITAFASVSPRTSLLATSQTEGRKPFATFHLPADVHEHVGKLLRAHMDPERGSALEERLRTDCPELLASLRSGYDIRLLIDLANSPDASPLPSTRAGLYQAILAVPGPDYPLDDLGALAWKMWLAGQRQLPTDDATRKRIIDPLERENGMVIRRLSEDSLEFRHDQMRAYLAAHWLVGQAANAEAMLVHLRSDAVWRVAARDQDEAWPFVAALLRDELLSPIWRFAVAAPERVRLQHSVQAEAGKRGLRLDMASPLDPAASPEMASLN